MKLLIGVIITSFFLQGCVAYPVKQADKKASDSSRFSVEKIKKQRELEYAKKLTFLNKRNPVQDARQAQTEGKILLLMYQSGRGGTNKVPGLTHQQVANTACKFKQLDGLGDSIFGNNHLKYRVAVRKYASQFNLAMLPYCQ